MKEFYRREAAQEEAGTMYCLELPQNAEGKTYCIDSGFSGNHARFINHSVSLGLIFTVGQMRLNADITVPASTRAAQDEQNF